MPWSGALGSQTFSRTNGTFNGTQVWASDSAANTKIISSNHDTHDQDIATGLNACLKNDGGNSATANIPMGGFRFSNVGNATARTQFAAMAQIQDGGGVYSSAVTGTANAIAISTGFSVAAYAAGQRFMFIAASANTGAVTLAVDGLAAKNVYAAGVPLIANQITAGVMIEVIYDGTQFQMSSSLAVAPAAIPVGTIGAWTTPTIPTGWLECNGSAVSRTTYASLFAVIASSYGNGDGSTTFNLPDYRGYFLRGQDAGAGIDPDRASRTNRGDGTTGDNVGTKQANQFASHTHTASVTDPGHNHTVTAMQAGNANPPSGSGAQNEGTSTSLTTSTATTGISVTNTAIGGNETRPQNVNVKWMILALPQAAIPTSTLTVTPEIFATGNRPPTSSSDGNDTTPSTTTTYICEIFIPANCTVTGVAMFNGSAAAGNMLVGLANASGSVVAQSASTAASGTTAYQRIPFTAAYSAVGPGTYYVLLQNSSASNRPRTHAFGNFGASSKTGETYGTLTTYTPPTTFTANVGPMASLY